MRKVISLIFIFVLLFVNNNLYAESGKVILTGTASVVSSTGVVVSTGQTISSTGNVITGTGVVNSSGTLNQVPSQSGSIDDTNNVISNGNIENLTFEYYYGKGCSHCAKVDEYMEAVDGFNKFKIIPKEIYQNDDNRSQYLAAGERLGITESDMGIPFLVINDSGKESYLEGDQDIINYFKQYLGEAPETSKKGIVLTILLILAIIIPIYLIKLSK